MISLLYFILIITILVFFHELGHYSAAKSVGVRVEKFYVGFNLFGLGIKKKYKGTEYGVGLFPFGGYVKVAGVIDESLDSSESTEKINDDDYRSKNTIQKVWIMSAGVIMNVVVSVFIFAILSMTVGEAVGLRVRGINNLDLPANRIGIEQGDSIISINNNNVSSIKQLQKELHNIDSLSLDNVLVSYFDVSNNKIEDTLVSISENRMLGVGIDTLDFTVNQVISNPFVNSSLKENQIITSINDQVVTSIFDLNEDLALNYKDIITNSGRIIIDDSNQAKLPIGYVIDLVIARGDRLNPLSALIYGVDNTYKMLNKIIVGISNISKENLGGPVRIAQESSKIADRFGFEGIMMWMAMLSLNLAIINILPFPGLDGGHVVIAIVEGIIGREIGKEWKIRIQVLGMIFLLLVFSLVLWNDISKLF